MKNKKGIVFGLLGLAYLIAFIIILILLIWIGYKSVGVLSLVFGTLADFFTKYWIWLLVGLLGVVFHQQVFAFLKFAKKRIGG